ncbi:uncharacterized protein LOC133531493 isoform X3 [Cydia pomonella]|uniref:uncharacterized protein LOC133531493 isoform X3 n=1 Tax=Cydia pomonella TaxID=82600 RepID=UPI002ADDADD8|nr:uncharacterized protein LOC133531493 isoform X3 [Cydia pomonella]
MSVESVRVKQEPLWDGVGSCAPRDVTSPRNDQVNIKKETEYIDDAESTEQAQVKEEPWCLLYADHVVKEELVLGPECMQRQHIDTAVQNRTNVQISITMEEINDDQLCSAWD